MNLKSFDRKQMADFLYGLQGIIVVSESPFLFKSFYYSVSEKLTLARILNNGKHAVEPKRRCKQRCPFTHGI